MGVRSSKVIITAETKPSAATPEPAAKEVFRNGNTEAILSIDEVATEPKGDYTKLPDETDTTLPAVDECLYSKKKKHPINWIQKKISVKKLKTPKKAPASGETAATETAAVAEDTVKNTNEQPAIAVVPPVGDIQTQAKEVTKVDQSTEKSERPTAADASTTEPVVEIVPTDNCVASQKGDEHFIADSQEDAPKHAGVPVEVPEQGDAEEETAAEDESNTSALAEKLANLEIESTHSAAVDTDEAVVTDGDADVLHDN